MSATSTDQTGNRHSRRAAAVSENAPSNGADQSTETVVVNHGFNTIEINDQEVSVAIRFVTGHVLSENEAKVIQAAYERQFTNNQNALADARSKGKNTTPQPDAAKLAEMFLDYAPSVGGTTRQSTMEKLRHDAAWRYWVALEKAHNEAVLAGGKPVIAAAVDASGKPRLVGVKFKAVKDAEGKVTTTAEDQKQTFTTKLLSAPTHAAGIQTALDAILAERGSKKPETTDTVLASGDDLI